MIEIKNFSACFQLVEKFFIVVMVNYIRKNSKNENMILRNVNTPTLRLEI